MIVSIMVTLPLGSAQAQGVDVTNTATVSFEVDGFPTSTSTGPAVFTIEAERTPSTVEFFRFSPAAPDSIPVQINGSDFLTPSGFVPLGTPLSIAGDPISLATPISLVSTPTFFAGESIFVQVEDLGQNIDPTVIESVTTTITSGTGDAITLRLFETGPNTGVFFGFVQSEAGIVDPADDMLAVARNGEIDATYQDPFDATEISNDAAGVDPFTRIFDSNTGVLIDGASVTLVDIATGQPATVFGIDGVSPYPATIISGASASDASGFLYEFQAGEFLFPIVAPGDYRYEVIAPTGYTAPSTALPSAFEDFDTGPFSIGDASFGGVFTQTVSGTAAFDIPLDPETDIVVQKTSSVQSASIGDFVRYDVTVENRAALPIAALIRDVLPRGFRYQAGSARLDGAEFPNPSIDGGENLTFAAGLLAPGAIITISYVIEVTGGTDQGEAVNRAFVINGAGQLLSNIGENAITVRDDFLRNQLTIVGRVAENACTPTDPWPRKISDGKGVSGVRLYMETGAYVVTDEDGLYHFENVDVKTHVVQVDETTIPAGYRAIICEDNTRYAGRATSKFVDAQGGSVWRANFYLEKTGEGATTLTEEPEAAFNEAAEYLNYSKKWLDQQTNEISWAYPALGASPTIKSVNLGLKHPRGLRVALYINGQKAPALFFAGREVSSDRKIALTRWSGVHLLDGDNVIKAVVTDLTGNEVSVQERTISFVTAVERATLSSNGSYLVADGVKGPVIAVRLTDGAGRAVHRGKVVNFNVEAPYRAKTQQILEDALPLTAPGSAQATATVGRDGVALIELQPTLQTGRVRLSIPLEGGDQEEISVQLKPALRDWIVVGLVEGELSAIKETGAAAPLPQGRDLLREGRAAVFAKGVVGNDWLITAAGDTDKRRGSIDDELFDVIDPDDRFPLYGDRTDQQFEAQSRYPIYLKAEKDGFQGVIGDFDTDLRDAKLGRYNRRFTGAQATYESEKFSFSGFAADTNQFFVKDELAGDGTSGPYQLSQAPLVRNSESLTIETRDRFRPDIIVATKQMIRFLDYDIDFETGEIIFRLPVPATDEAFNNNIIVVDYETSEAVDRSIIAGGRAALRVLGNRGEVGATFIHEDGVAGAEIGDADLAGVDFVVDVNEKTEVRLEYAGTRRETSQGTETADAILAEIDYTSERIKVGAYYADTEENFGLAQQNSAVSGVRRFGGNVRLRLDEYTSGEGTVRGERFVEAETYREENLTTGARRTVVQASVGQASNTTSGTLGLRRVVEEPAGGETRRSLLLTAEARQNFQDAGLTLRASRDQPLGGDDASTQFPARTTFGIDKQLFGSATLSATHEVLDGATQSSSNTTIGLSTQLWKGARLSASSDRVTQESSERIGATFGVDQELRFSEKWSGSLGVTRREDLKSEGQIDLVDDIVPDQPTSPQDINGDFTSVYVGAGYSGEKSTGSARGELRKSDDGQRYTLIAGSARELSDHFSYAGAARYSQENNDLIADRRTADARFGAAWRPRGEGIIAFNRFDLGVEEIDDQSRSWKAVNNFALNTQVSERLQIALNHGLKYSVLETGDDRFAGFTQLAGLEARYDITRNIDIGIHGSALISHNAGTIDYAFGPSIGANPTDNVWISLGYNIDGFVDDDFEAAEYTRQGPFVKLRIKFDQNDARDVLNRLSLGTE